MGDALLTIPLIRRLKKVDPQSSIIFVCRPGYGDFFERLGLVDEVLELDKRNITGLEEFRERLSRYSIRYLISVHQSVRTALALRNIRAEQKISYRQWWNRPFFNLRVLRPMGLPEPLRVLALLSPIDPSTAEQINKMNFNGEQNNLPTKASILSWPNPLPAEHSMAVECNSVAVEQVLAQVTKPYAIIAPSSQWTTKQWTSSGYVELIEKLEKQGLNVYLVGTRNEREVCESIRDTHAKMYKRPEVHAQTEVRSLAGRFDLVHLHALMSRAEVIVANDSGSMHLAAAAARPVVGIFGPTVLRQGYRPWADESAIVQIDLGCRPCGRHGHKECPLGTHECMKRITAEMVMGAVGPYLKSTAESERRAPV